MNLRSLSVFQQAGLGWWPAVRGQPGDSPAQEDALSSGPWGRCPGVMVQFFLRPTEPTQRILFPPFLQLPLPCTTPGSLGISVSISQARPFMLREAGGLAHGCRPVRQSRMPTRLCRASEPRWKDCPPTPPPPPPPPAWFILMKGAVCQHPVPSSK